MTDYAWLAAILGVGVVGVYTLRREGESLGHPYWAAAWTIFFLSAPLRLLTLVPTSVDHTLEGLTGSLFSGLILAGAIRFSGRPVPRWLLALFALWALGRMGLCGAGHVATSDALGLAVDPATSLAAAAFVFWVARGQPGLVTRWLLPLSLVSLAAIDATDALSKLGSAPRVALDTAWLAVSLSAVGTMFGAGLERSLWGANALRRSLTERASAHRARRDLVKAVFDMTPSGLLLSDDKQRIIAANRSQSEWLGLDSPTDLIGRPLRAALTPPGTTLPPELEALMEEPLEGPRATLRGVEVGLPGQPPRTWLIDTYPVAGAGNLRPERVWLSLDVSTQRRLERELAANETAETLGRLAGGIAHDFNNHLTVVRGNAQVALAGLPQDDARGELLREVLRATRHSAALTAKLVAFCQSRPRPAEAVDPTAVLEAIGPLVRSALPSTAELAIASTHSLPSILVNENQLQQALLQLTLDARDSMSVVRRLELGADRLLLEGPSNPSTNALASGEYVRFTVRASGDTSAPPPLASLLQGALVSDVGASREGLGFAIVFGFVAVHGGFVTVESPPDGTAVHLHLPIC